jgi:hypothetical protein
MWEYIQYIIFSFLVVLYNLCLAVTDAAFNRMIRNSIVNWEQFREWEAITICFNAGCVFLPYMFVLMISSTYALLYVINTCFVFWDVVFGKLVFGKWTGDHPSGKVLGKWIRIRLWKLITLRTIFGSISIVILVVMNTA